ncbi:MAG TPA: hypothetical protein V6C97_30965 [Oculatellaceae cyanobacterium]
MFRCLNFAVIFAGSLIVIVTLTFISSRGLAAPAKVTSASSGTAHASAGASPAVSSNHTIVMCLKQQGSLVGAESIYISSDAIRIDNLARSVVAVAHAPAWDVTTYNPTVKKYCVNPLDKYHGQMTHIFLFYGIDMSVYDFVEDHKIKFLNHQAISMKAVPNKKDTENKSVTAALKLFIVADAPNIPQKAADVLTRQLCLPITHKLPLRMDYLTDRLTQKAIDTVSWEKQTVDKNWFDVPSGYVRCKKESDVCMEENF